MNSHHQSIIVSFFLAVFFTLPVSAADMAAGEQKAELCASCHGPKGNSSNGQTPNLAGQQSTYLANQLKAYKTGNRLTLTMLAVAANLTNEDINNLAAYFSTQKPIKTSSADQELAKTGEAKANMCLGCHGAKAQGNGQFPRLAGQPTEYLAQQLKAFKEGSRKSGTMQAITASMSEADFKALAAYFGSL